MTSARLNDVTIYAADVATLAPRCWLNDQVIAYQLEVLAQRASDAVLLLEPQLVFTAAMVPNPEMLREMLGVSRTRGATSMVDVLATAGLVIMPVNDNDDADAANGGGHWSLLCYRRSSGSAQARFEHYDSCGNANAATARAIAHSLIRLLQPDESGPKAQLVTMQSPQQTNGCDCGVYLLSIAEILVDSFTQSIDPKQKILALKPNDITTKRNDLWTIMENALQ